MSFLKKLVKKAGNVVKDVGKGIAKAKDVLLPIAGVAAGLALPGIGGIVGKVVGKIGGKAGGAIGKISQITGIGDGKPGVFGIGDDAPGILGIGTGAAALKALKKLTGQDLENIKSADVKLAKGEALTLPEQLAKQKQADVEPDSGIPGWLKVVGGIAAAVAISKL